MYIFIFYPFEITFVFSYICEVEKLDILYWLDFFKVGIFKSMKVVKISWNIDFIYSEKIII